MPINSKKMTVFQSIKIPKKQNAIPTSDSEIIAIRKKMQSDYLLGQDIETLHTFYEIQADED